MTSISSKWKGKTPTLEVTHTVTLLEWGFFALKFNSYMNSLNILKGSQKKISNEGTISLHSDVTSYGLQLSNNLFGALYESIKSLDGMGLQWQSSITFVESALK